MSEGRATTFFILTTRLFPFFSFLSYSPLPASLFSSSRAREIQDLSDTLDVHPSFSLSLLLLLCSTQGDFHGKSRRGGREKVGARSLSRFNSGPREKLFSQFHGKLHRTAVQNYVHRPPLFLVVATAAVVLLLLLLQVVVHVERVPGAVVGAVQVVVVLLVVLVVVVVPVRG